MAEWHDQEGRHDDPTPAEFAKWLAPENCFRHLSDGVPDKGLVNRILKRLGDGKLVAAASEARWKSEHHGPGVRYAPTTIDPSWWLNARDVQTPYSDIWRTGEFSCLIEYEDGFRSTDEVLVNFYGVRFELGEMLTTVPGLKQQQGVPLRDGGYLVLGTNSIATAARDALGLTPDALVGVPMRTTGAEVEGLRARIFELESDLRVAPRRAGGRPPKPFWDEMWAEMVRLMYVGALKWSRLSEVEEAMHDWLAANRHEAGETVVRERARILFNLLKNEDGN